MDSTLKLIIEKGPREGETLEFKSGTVIRIGRVVRGNTLAIKDSGISSKHLVIQFVPEKSQWLVSDLDSSNGTVLNGNKLNPTEPADLTDGATIKLGELTSIKVQIESNVTSQLRRNPKRGVAKLGKQETDKSEEDSELGLGDNKEQKDKAVKKPPRGRGRPKREAVLEEIPESSCKVVDEVEELSNVDPVLPKQGRQVCSRRTRNSKEVESLFSDSITGDTLKELSKDKKNLRESEELVPFANPRTRGGGRRKKNLQIDKQFEELGEECSKPLEKTSPNNENLREDKLETLGEECAEGLVRSSPANETLGHKQLEDLCDERIEASEKNSPAKDNLVSAEKVEKPDEPCAKQLEDKSLGQAGYKDSGGDIGESPNLENLTVGEWFDYLEMALPKEIYDATEEMVAGMRKKAEQFHEFMLQHNKAKAKTPME